MMVHTFNTMPLYEIANNNTSDDIFYCSLGNVYKAMKYYNKAENAYKYASYMVPHKLYPLYLLVILYVETGQDEKAVTIATRLLSKEVKVESEAAKDIKEAVQKIVNKQTY